MNLISKLFLFLAIFTQAILANASEGKSYSNFYVETQAIFQQCHRSPGFHHYAFVIDPSKMTSHQRQALEKLISAPELEIVSRKAVDGGESVILKMKVGAQQSWFEYRMLLIQELVYSLDIELGCLIDKGVREGN